MAFRAAGTATKNGGSGNITSVGLPAGHTTNDILVLVISAADNVVCSVNQSYTSKVLTNGTTSARQEIWWKRDGGSEVAPTVTHTAGNSATAQILAFSGCITSGDPFSQAAAQANNGSATVTAPTITPGNNEDCVFAGTACSNTDTGGAPITQASYSGTNPTYTERGDAEESTGTKEAALALATGTSNGSSTGSRTSATTSGFAAAAIDNVGAQLSLLQAVSGGLAALPATGMLPLSGLGLPGQPTAAPQPPASGSPPSAFDIITPLPSTQFLNPLSLVLGAQLFPAARPLPAAGAVQDLGAITVNAVATVAATLVKTAVLTATVNGTATVGATLVKSAFLGPLVNGVTTVSGSVVGLKVLVPTVNGLTTVGVTVGTLAGAVSNTLSVDANRVQHLISEVR